MVTIRCASWGYRLTYASRRASVASTVRSAPRTIIRSRSRWRARCGPASRRLKALPIHGSRRSAIHGSPVTLLTSAADRWALIGGDELYRASAFTDGWMATAVAAADTAH